MRSDREVSRFVTRAVPLIAIAAVLTAAGCGSGDSGPVPPSLSSDQRARIGELLSTPPFDRGSWGILASNTATGEVLLSKNARKLRSGASTTKNFTVAATLGELGPNHDFETPVFRLGPVSDGVLRGDLVLQASGDLTMGGRDEGGGKVAYTGFDHMDSNELPGPAELTPQDPLAGLDRLAGQVAESGIEEVRGDVTIDDRLWKSTLVGKEVVSPIIINDNAIDITLTPGEPGQVATAEIRPQTSAYRIKVETQTGPPGSTLDPQVGELEGRTVTVGGSIPADSDPVVQIFRSPDPAYFGRTLFIEALERQGIAVRARTRAPNRAGGLPDFDQVAESPRVAVLTSPPVSEFAKLILKVSHNLGANTAPFWLAVQDGRRTFEAGMELIREYTLRAGVPARQFVLEDGQGLEGNRFSPLAMVTLLKYAADQAYGEDFRNAMPVKGVDGIPDRPEDDPGTGNVVAKNGLLGGLNDQGEIEVQAMALAGYAGEGESQVAFDVVVNGVPILPNGQSSDDPEKLTAAFTRFGPLEGITTEFYLAGQ